MTERRSEILWIVNADGANHRPLSAGKRKANSPGWSPAGRRPTCLSDKGGSTQIHVRWMDKGDTVAITGGGATRR